MTTEQLIYTRKILLVSLFGKRYGITNITEKYLHLARSHDACIIGRRLSLYKDYVISYSMLAEL